MRWWRVTTNQMPVTVRLGCLGVAERPVVVMKPALVHFVRGLVERRGLSSRLTHEVATAGRLA